MRYYIVILLSLFSIVCDAQFMQFAPKKAEAEFVLLDTFGTGNQYAFSMYKIRSNYTGDCMLVRRSNDNATQRIGFSGDFLDTAALKTFVGVNSGFVVRWYNQSPNRSDSAFMDSVLSRQPRIVNAGVIERDRGIAVIRFDGVNDVLPITDNSSVFQNISHAYGAYVGRNTASVASAYFSSLRLSSTGSRFTMVQTATIVGTTIRPIDNGAAVSPLNTIVPPTIYLNSALMNTSTDVHFARYNNVPNAGTSLITGNTSNTSTSDVIGAIRLPDGTGFNAFLTGVIAEILVWNNNQSSNVDRINTNINRRYKLY